MQYVITIHSILNDPGPIIGPFKTKREAIKWRDTYTQHEVNTALVEPLLNPKDTVRKYKLGRKR
jgi:hypothetical protein